MPTPAANLPLSSLVLRRGSDARCLVLVHGYAETPDSLTDRLRLIDPDGRFTVVVPTAPFTWKDRAIWHRPMSDPETAARQYLDSLGHLDALVGAIDRELGIASADTIVGGFSQGGGLAVGLLLGADVEHRPAAAFGVCSFPPLVPHFRVDRARADGAPYLLLTARRDHFAPIETCRQGGRVLLDTGIDLTYGELDSEHVMTDEAAERVGAWLADPGGVADERHLLVDVEPRSIFDGVWDFVDG